MPVYEFRVRGCGQTIDRFFPVNRVPKVLTEKNDPDGRLRPGERADRVLFPAPSIPHRPNPGPIESTSFGVGPANVKRAQEYYDCKFTPEGRARFRTTRQRDAVLKKAGWHNE